jgi:hypothetical protein
MKYFESGNENLFCAQEQNGIPRYEAKELVSPLEDWSYI